MIDISTTKERQLKSGFCLPTCTFFSRLWHFVEESFERWATPSRSYYHQIDSSKKNNQTNVWLACVDADLSECIGVEIICSYMIIFKTALFSKFCMCVCIFFSLFLVHVIKMINLTTSAATVRVCCGAWLPFQSVIMLLNHQFDMHICTQKTRIRLPVSVSVQHRTYICIIYVIYLGFIMKTHRTVTEIRYMNFVPICSHWVTLFSEKSNQHTQSNESHM